LIDEVCKNPMKFSQLQSLEKQLSDFVEQFAPVLGRSERRYWCKLYLTGLLLDGERKSIEPLATRLPGGDEQCLQQFVNQSPWPQEAVQRQLICLLAKRFGKNPGVLALDDTSLPKKGEHSVGVARQYCGALGKVANCQAIVTWHFTNSKAVHYPLLGQLYLPESWTADPERLERAGVPEANFIFRKKWQIALDLLDQMPEEVAYEAVVMDAGYGEIREFLGELDKRQVTFVAQAPESHGFWPADIAVTTAQKPIGRPRKFETVADPKAQPLSAKQWRLQLEASSAKWQEVKLSLQKEKSVKVLAVRLRETVEQAWRRPGPERWLLIEKRADGSHRYWVSNAAINTTIRQMILLGHQRWQVEQGDQQMKEELGLDHFEGRSWRGLHHHLTLCFMAYGFLRLVQERKKSEVNGASRPQADQRRLKLDQVSALRARASSAKRAAI
jgi:SRSO17 transposase